MWTLLLSHLITDTRNPTPIPTTTGVVLNKPCGPKRRSNKLIKLSEPCTRNINSAFAKIARDTLVPFAPHYAYELKVKGSDFVVGTRLRIPKPLPIEQFQVKYNNMSDEDKSVNLDNANKIAASMLANQKDKTGYAILGRPPPELIVDKKVQRESATRSHPDRGRASF